MKPEPVDQLNALYQSAILSRGGRSASAGKVLHSGQKQEDIDSQHFIAAWGRFSEELFPNMFNLAERLSFLSRGKRDEDYPETPIRDSIRKQAYNLWERSENRRVFVEDASAGGIMNTWEYAFVKAQIAFLANSLVPLGSILDTESDFNYKEMRRLSRSLLTQFDPLIHIARSYQVEDRKGRLSSWVKVETDGRLPVVSQLPNPVAFRKLIDLIVYWAASQTKGEPSSIKFEWSNDALTVTDLTFKGALGAFNPNGPGRQDFEKVLGEIGTDTAGLKYRAHLLGSISVDFDDVIIDGARLLYVYSTLPAFPIASFKPVLS